MPSVPALNSASSAAPLRQPADPLREAAHDLHRSFVTEMLKQAKLAEALGAEGEGSLSAPLADFALTEIAGDVVAAQPAFTDRLYTALSRSAS